MYVQPPVFGRARTESNLRQFVGGKSRISYHHIIQETYTNAMRIPTVTILVSITANTTQQENLGADIKGTNAIDIAYIYYRPPQASGFGINTST